jgi:hypothetical protein
MVQEAKSPVKTRPYICVCVCERERERDVKFLALLGAPDIYI